MRTYEFKTSNINQDFDQCKVLLENLSFQVLDSDKRTKMIEAVLQESKIFSRHIHLKLNHLESNVFQLHLEVRNIGLELVKDPKNKKLEQKFVRAFHQYLMDQKGPKSLAQSA